MTFVIIGACIGLIVSSAISPQRANASVRALAARLGKA